MKKYFLFAAAAVIVLAGCSKIENTTESLREISFEVANSVSTKAVGAVYDNGAFGTYAWFNGADPYMVNEQIDKVGGVWKSVDNTYYWPKTGSITFVSYSPFVGASNTAGTTPAVTMGTANDSFKYKLAYSGVTVGDTDLLYSDVATCSENVDYVTDTPDSGFTGVPTVFRHALARLRFQIKASFTSKTDATTGSTTSWKVVVTSAVVSGLKDTGDCELTIGQGSSVWTKPVTNIGTDADPDNVNIWTNASGAAMARELVDAGTYPAGVTLVTAAQSLSGIDLVLPQQLVAGAQKLSLTMHISTYLPNGNTLEEDIVKTCDLASISSRKAWQINENVIYTINISPAAVDEDNPDTPQEITFDPAVATWTSVAADANIQL